MKINIIIGALAFALGFFLGWLTDTTRTPGPIRVTDTLTQVQWDTIYLQRYDTLEYYDTMIDYENGEIEFIIDTIQAPVPINHYSFDTTMRHGDSIKTRIKADLSGFHVRVEQLTTETEIKPQEAVSEPYRLYKHLCPAFGLGYGTGGFGIFAGIGYKF